MEKHFCLPKISISELEQTAKQKRNHTKYNYGKADSEKEGMHHQDIKVSSPFYQRCSNEGKCLCQVHRLKKLAPSVIQHRSTQHHLNPMQPRCSHPQTYPHEQQKGKRQIRSTLTQQSSSLQQRQQPLPNTLPLKNTGENAVLDGQNSVILQYAKTIPKLPTRKTLKSHKDKIQQNNQANCKVQTLNMEFIRLVSARLSNYKFKQKYLKTLFGFIKMKSMKDRTYLCNSKAYLHNSLNMLLNHISMATLLDYQHLTQEQIAQVAYYMNCFPDRVRGILHDLGRAVSEMERALDEMRNAQGEKENNEAGLDGHNEQYASIFTEGKEGTLDMTTKESLLNEHNTSIISHQHIQDSIKSPKEKILKRSSSRRMNDLFTSSLSKQFIPAADKQKHSEQSMRHSIKISHKNKENLQKQIMNRSLRSTVLVTVDEAEKEKEKEKEQPIHKKHPKTKKSRLKSKNTGQVDDKYSKIQFQKYLSRRSFNNLIISIDRPDQNDMDRALSLFKDFKVENHLDDQQRIEDIIKTFNPLFNQKSLHYFLRHVVMERDRRFIERLERELDDMLQEVKKNDPRNQNVDFFETKAEKKVPLCMSKMAKCREIKVDRRDTIQHIKYFEAEEQVQRHKTKQRSVKQHLQQVELQGITFATIDPSLSVVLTHLQSKQHTQHFRSTHVPDVPNQKRILQYMRRKHQGTFNYLTQQFRTLCRSISKQPKE